MKGPAQIPPVFDLLGQEIKEGSFVVYSSISGTKSDTTIGLVVGFAWTKPEEWRGEKPRVLVRFRQVGPRKRYWNRGEEKFEFGLPDGTMRELTIQSKRLSSSSDHERFVVVSGWSLPRDLAAFMRARA